MSLIQIKAKYLSRDMYQANNFLILEGMEVLAKIDDKIRNVHKAYSPINFKLNQYYIKIIDEGLPLIPRQTYTLGLYLVNNTKKSGKVYYHFVIQQYQRFQDYKPVNIDEL